MPVWRILRQSAASAREQMAVDERLAQEAMLTVRFFRWAPPAVSLGMKQAIPSWLEASSRRRNGLEVVRRPTGGGIALHGSDLSLSVVVPRALGVPLQALMRAACQSGLALCRYYGVEATAYLDRTPARVTHCLAETSSYAVMVEGWKVAGFAIRRYAQTWLIQGSLLVRPLPSALVDALPAELVGLLRSRAMALSDVAESPSLDMADVERQWAERWSEWWEEALVEELEALAA